MKKIILLIALIFGVLTSNAQHIAEATTWSEESEFNHSGLFLNPTLGVLTGDIDTDFGVDLTLGYRWHITSGFNWDILKVGASTGVSNFTEGMTLRFLSGFRYNSPAILGDKSLYADCAFGYSFMTDDTDFGGFAYEVGVGVNLTRTISLGIVWEGNNPHYSWEDYYEGYYYKYTAKFSYGTFGVRLGLNF